MPRPPRREAAYSLLELLTMIAIIAVMAAIAGPRYANALADYRAAAAAQRIAADIALAAAQAKMSSAGQSVSFDVAGNTYTLAGVAGLTGESATYSVNLSKEPYNAVLQSAAFGNATILAFDRYGQPSAGGTVVVVSGGYTKTITVDTTTGAASIQ